MKNENQQDSEQSNSFAQIAKSLAMTDAQSRLNSIEELKQLIQNTNQQTFKDYKKIWKALFYAMWDSDKQAIQYQLAEVISKIHNQVQNVKIVVWIKACFFILNQHWNNIDYLRINKFLYMVRLLLTEIFVYIKNQSWNKKILKKLMSTMLEQVFDPENITDGLVLHIIQIFMQTLNDQKPSKHLTFILFISPWIKKICETDKKQIRVNIKQHIFDGIIDMKKNSQLKCLKIKKLYDKLFEIAISKEITQVVRNLLYEICEQIELFLEEKKSNKIVEVEVKEKKQKNKKQKSVTIQEEDDNKENLPNKKKKKLNQKVEQSQEDDFMEDNDLLVDSDGNPLEFEGSIEEEEEDSDFEINQDQEEEGDFDDEEDFQEMSSYDLKQLKKMYPNLPEYMFQTPKQRRQYFQNLNKTYAEKINKEQNKLKHTHTKSVVINLKKNKVQEFDKLKKIESNSIYNKHKKADKGILKQL